MDKEEIQKYFTGILEKEEDVSAGIAAIRTLLTVLERDKSETVQELDSNLRAAGDAMRSTEHPGAAVRSGCELFLRFITLAKLDTETFAECKAIMLQRGKLFLKKLMESRSKVARRGARYIIDGSKVLTHSHSRVVLQTMQEAARANKRFDVYVTTSSPDSSGVIMSKKLRELGIPVTLIMDSAVGYIMEQVDFVMVGAEGVVESGGAINKVGSYVMALCAREAKKPFYVLCESFKFVRLYPLNQQDLPDEFKKSKSHPLVDYTPPAYITLLFTDLGVLSPSAVSDELIKLYL